MQAKDDAGDSDQSEGPPTVTNYRRSIARRVAVSAEAGGEAGRSDAESWKSPCYEKSAEERRQLSEIIRTSTDGRLRTVFASVPDDIFEKVLDAMFSKTVVKGEHVLKQGDAGDYFYIVKSGKLDIHVDAVKVFEAGPGMAFGELALLYNAARLATITAVEDSECWCLERTSFRNLVVAGAGRAFAQNVSFLKQCDIFHELNSEQIAALAEVVQEEEFENDEAILVQGEKDDNMYIMRAGEAVACIDGSEGEVEVMLYREGDYFGEIALLRGEPRKATVYAKGPCSCMYISRTTFRRVLGSLAEFLQKNMSKYEKYQDALKVASEHTGEESFLDMSLTASSFVGLEVFEGATIAQAQTVRRRRERREQAPDVDAHKVEKELKSEAEPTSLEEKVRSDFKKPELVEPAKEFSIERTEVQAFGGLRMGEKFKSDKVAVVRKSKGVTVNSDGVEDEHRWNELTVWKGSTHLAVLCQKGQKRPDDPTPNQDNYFVCHLEEVALYGVADGHGPFGHLVSFRVVQTLPSLIASNPNYKKDWRLCLKEAFLAAQQDLLQFSDKHDINIEASGAACSVIAVEKHRAHVAHLGDSTALLASWNRHKQRLVFHTTDHKPGLPEEKARLEAAGNDVREEGDPGTHRIYLKGTNFPGLTMSRAFGDTACAGVLQEPSYEEVTLEGGDDYYALIASDGIWEFIEPDKVVELLTKKLRLKGPREAIKYLVDCSRKCWAKCCGDYCDDITGVLVQWNVQDKGADTNHLLMLNRHE